VIEAIAPSCIDACGPCDDCCTCDPPTAAVDKRRLARMAWGLTAFTIVWNVLEAGVAISSGIVARSIALVSFGLDSLVEVSSATVIAWWLARHGDDEAAHEERERVAVRLIAVSFFGIAAYVVWDATLKLTGHDEAPERSWVGIGLVAASIVVMPALAMAKRRVATRLGSVALHADAAETQLCSYLSAIVLVGLLANGVLGWWWLDPIAGLVVAGIATHEGIRTWTSGDLCGAAPASCLISCCPACPIV
jgi:divalent metal cation (Fe/Co/Zn/Cd) transporter